MSTCQKTKAFSRRAVGKAAAARPSATLLYLAVCLAMMNSARATEGETLVAQVDPTLLAFNTSFLNGQGRPADLSAVLSSGSSVPPGNYRVEVEVNGNLVGRRDIDFYQDTDKAKLRPCLTAKMLQDFGVNLSAINPPLDVNSQACLDLPHLLDQASVDFDAGRLQLNLSIPQAFLSRAARG
ncbi:FimD/PapC N-terminal domain-containing protein [Ralstonia mannitolilytica]|uniref:FimD/PapC N-terminal domain-containing protein n=1 Tax=Ralstonia mannitolilytica TaxID=105219 RepID=UPI0029319C2B|nr:FimD/PapC N-terminal domain-containing protein [Ralstonia mannitolilytica]